MDWEWTGQGWVRSGRTLAAGQVGLAGVGASSAIGIAGAWWWHGSAPVIGRPAQGYQRFSKRLLLASWARLQSLNLKLLPRRYTHVRLPASRTQKKGGRHDASARAAQGRHTPPDHHQPKHRLAAGRSGLL